MLIDGADRVTPAAAVELLFSRLFLRYRSRCRRRLITRSHNIFPCRRHRAAQYIHIADVVREQQDQLRVDQRALFVAELAVQVDQLLVEVIGRGDIGFTIERHATCLSATEICAVAFTIAARTAPRSNARQRAQTCWSGRKRYAAPGRVS